ncbi:hypothetical protein BS78_03G244900 [Paspalum vaginatum]|nr:hypothetical protein BS78_03G244900 [Paspalum vaginatum]
MKQALDNAMLTQAAIPAAAPTKSGCWLLNCRILKGSAAKLPYPLAPAAKVFEMHLARVKKRNV